MTCPTCNQTVSPVKLGRLTLCPQCGEVLVIENRATEDKLSDLVSDLNELMERKNAEIERLEAELAAIRPVAAAMECQNCWRQEWNKKRKGFCHPLWLTGQYKTRPYCPATGVLPDCPLVAAKRKEAEAANG